MNNDTGIDWALKAAVWVQEMHEEALAKRERFFQSSEFFTVKARIVNRGPGAFIAHDDV